MKIKTISFAAMLISAVFSVGAAAQSSLFILSYNVSVPTLDTMDFIEKESFRGITVEGRKFTAAHMSFGLSGSWHVFNEETDEILPIDNGQLHGHVSGTQFRYINAVPLSANVLFWLGGNEERLRLYFGSGVGATYSSRRLEIGQVGFQEDEWLLTVLPEVGVTIPLGDMQLLVAGRYHYSFSGDESVGADLSYVSINIGVAYALYQYLW